MSESNTSSQNPAPETEEFPISNHKHRPRPADGIIIHSMGQHIEGAFAGDFLQDFGLSAHFLIDHTGKVFECVDPDQQAYHAGGSKLGDQENLNSTFIGIELLVEGDHTYGSFLEAIKNEGTFTENHYHSCQHLCKQLIDEFDIDIDRIVRHSDVSGPDVRPDPKKDPGSGFDFDYIVASLNGKSNEQEHII